MAIHRCGFASALLLGTIASAQAPGTDDRPRRIEPTAAGAALLTRVSDVAAREAASDKADERRELVRELAQGLGAEDWAVRVRCVELLATAVARDAAVDALIAGAGRFGPERAARLLSLTTKLKELRPAGVGNDELAKQIDEFSKQLKASIGLAQQMLAVHADAIVLGDTYVRVFLDWPEAPRRRGLHALHAGLLEYEPSWLPHLLEVADAGVIELLGDIHATGAQRVVDAKDSATAAERHHPRPGTGSPDAQKRRDAELRARSADLERAQQALTGFAEAVARFAPRHGLPVPPAASAPNATWRTWCKTAAKALGGSAR